MIMVDERLYRLRSKDGSHFNEKTNEEAIADLEKTVDELMEDYN